MTQNDEAERPRSQRGRVPYRVLSLLVSGGLLIAGMAVVYHRIDWRDLSAVWTNLNPTLVVVAAILYWLQYPINSYRLQRVVIWSGVESSAVPPLKFFFKLTCSSAFVALAAPMGLAGDAAKIAAMRLFGSLSITEATRCALFDRVVGVQCIAMIGLVMLLLQAILGVDRSIILGQLALFIALIAAVGALLALPRMLALLRYDLVIRIARVFAGYKSLLQPKRLASVLSISALNIVSAWATLYLLLRAAGLDIDPWLVGGFIPLLQLVNGLPFLYMGWGGREITMTATLGAASTLGVNETLAVSIAWGVVLFMTSAVNGVFLLGNWQVAPSGASAETDRRS